MPQRGLDAEEAEILFRSVAGADFVAGAGRDFYFEIEISGGDVVRGLLVEKDEHGVTLTDAEGEAGQATVTWDDIRRVTVSGYT